MLVNEIKDKSSKFSIVNNNSIMFFTNEALASIMYDNFKYSKYEKMMEDKLDSIASENDLSTIISDTYSY